ncbi:roadblock/LC7 domain-containing protein [Streptomyces sp. NPDC088775]|uniref:roadblock/LC7 domain-containing protein n=1 Tax=Streptomyces sp. NPDC088775 TaxID=3365896 RepID=UPI0037F75E09
MNPNPEIQRILDERVAQIPHVLGAVVVTEDGIHRYISGWPAEGFPAQTQQGAAKARQQFGEHLSALASGMASLAGQQAKKQGGGAVLRTVVEMEGGWCVTARAGQYCVIALQARAEANLGALGFAVTDLSNGLGDMLDVDRRELARAQAQVASAGQQPG